MDLDTIKRGIVRIIEEKLQVPASNGQGDAISSARSLRLDSMAMLELVVEVEAAFGITLIDEELNAPEHFRSLDDIARLVLSKVQAQGAS